jgi:hypothetical protein
MSLHSYLVQGL